MYEKKKFKKIINFRPLFFIFIIGVLCIYFSFSLTNSLYNLFFFIVPLAFLVLIAIKKRYSLLIFSAIFFISSSLYTYFFLSNYNDASFLNTSVTITAKVEKITYVNDNFYYLTLSNSTVVLQDNSSSTLDGNVSVRMNVYDTEEFSLPLNSQIAFSCKLSSVDIKDENGELETFFLKWNIKYETNYVNYTAITYLQDDSNLIEKFQIYNKNLLIENLGETKGNLVYGILYGDKSSTSSEILEMFSFAGVIHVLSVSGLHVGLIVLLLIYFLKKLHLKDYAKFIIVFCFLLCFCTLCSFSSSILRASIMALTILLAGMFSRKSDILNSISLAGILILFFNPTSLFDMGFQMSFASVFGIIFVAFSAKFVIKNKKAYKILMPVIITISAELMLLPILANYYGFVPTWSILFNLFVLPLFSIMYSLLFVTNILVLIFPFLSFLYIFPKALLDIILYIVSLVNLMPFNKILTPNISLISTALFYTSLILLSKYFVLKNSRKIFLTSTLFLIFILTIILGSLPAKSSENRFTFYEESSSIGTLLATKQSKFYLIEPDLSNCYEIAEELKKLNISSLSGIIIFTNCNFESTKVYKYLYEFSPTIYLPKNSTHFAGLSSLGFETICNDDQKIIIDDYFAIKYFDYNSEPSTLLVEIRSQKIVFFKEISTFGSPFEIFITTNFDYTINCARILQDDFCLEWTSEVMANSYCFNSTSTQIYLVA
ncbi:MAG: ComEC/Rec2 family competence protein [Clostridia bacterium]|nr:ComEC/Rec2 family competence protein [Clostridia bacterium]